MTIISAYSIKPSFAASDVADENDSRNKREAKRKSASESPRMRQAERKNAEKLLSDALQLASNKAQRQSILESDAQSSAKRALDFIRAEHDSQHIDPDLSLDITDSNVSQKPPSKTITVPVRTEEKSLKFITVPVCAEEKPAQLSDCSKKLLEIESRLIGNHLRADLVEVLENLEGFNFELNNTKGISVLTTKPSNVIDTFNHDIDSMNCSIDFIEGYCEASSFNDEIKQKISNELNKSKSLLNQINVIDLPSNFPAGTVESIALQIAIVNAQKSLEFNLKFNANRTNSDNRKEAKNREDTLVLATLRSI